MLLVPNSTMLSAARSAPRAQGERRRWEAAWRGVRDTTVDPRPASVVVGVGRVVWWWRVCAGYGSVPLVRMSRGLTSGGPLVRGPPAGLRALGPLVRLEA